jgi:16S rRNA (cytosine1402-N4)-methyltransferase
MILSRLGAGGRLIALDRDPDAVKAGKAVEDARFEIVHERFSRLADLLAQLGVSRVDGILLDLGVSSPQLDEAARGFSFRTDAPLDMRMDTSHGKTAAQWLAVASEGEIRGVIKNYGEERFAKQIAAAIVAARARGPVGTTRQLAAIVAAAVPAREPQQDPATRTFQALRIHVNQELEELSLALPQCVELLGPAGRLVVISFHSLEDRIVKRFLRDKARTDHLPRRLPVRARDLPRPVLHLVGRAVRASAAEVAANPRARSAVMRVAEKSVPE